MSKKKISIQKAKETRRKTEKLYLRNYEKAQDNKIRWNYETAAKIYKESKKTGIAQSKLFDNKIERSMRQKSYYVHRKFNIDIPEAREIVKDFIARDIRYKDNPLIEEEKERKKFIEFIEPSGDVTAFMNFKEFLTDSVKTVIFNGKIYTKDEFEKLLSQIESEFENKIIELKINADYARFLNFFYVDENKDKNGNTLQVIFRQFDNNEILKEANHSQKEHKDFNIFL